MRKTTNLQLKQPEYEDFADIEDLNQDFDLLDSAIAEKLNRAGGDISDTVVSAIEEIPEEMPFPAAGDVTKTLLGKIVKFFKDVKGRLTSLSKRISEEQNRSSEAENQLSGQISTLASGISATSENLRKEYTRAREVEDRLSLRLDAEIQRALGEEVKKLDRSSLVNNTSIDRTDMPASSHVTNDLQKQLNRVDSASIKTEGATSDQKVMKITRESSSEHPNRIHFFSERTYVGYIDILKDG